MELSDEEYGDDNDAGYYEQGYYDVDDGLEEDIGEDDKGKLFLIIVNS